jgi:DNA excision repair protein ERCC-2
LNETILGLGLTSRRNLCLHPSVSKEKKGKVVDARCHNLTAPWVREAAQAGQDIETCSFYEELERGDVREIVPDAIYTLDDIKELGKAKKTCPYYMARRLVGPLAILISSAACTLYRSISTNELYIIYQLSSFHTPMLLSTRTITCSTPRLPT